MALQDFDYGEDLEKGGEGFTRENPKEGDHAARLKAIIHLGKCHRSHAESKDKPPVNMAVAVFELKEDYDVHSETGEPLLFAKDFTLMDGDRSFLHGEFIPALVTKEDLPNLKSFDDLIGKTCQLKLKGSKELQDDGSPKYINFASISSLHPKVAALTDPLKDDPLNGHIRLKDLQAGHLDLMNVYNHVQSLMLLSEQWKDGTHPAIPLIEEIRKERPNFAKATSKGDKSPDSKGKTDEPKPDAPVEKVDGDEEF